MILWTCPVCGQQHELQMKAGYPDRRIVYCKGRAVLEIWAPKEPKGKKHKSAIMEKEPEF